MESKKEKLKPACQASARRSLLDPHPLAYGGRGPNLALLPLAPLEPPRLPPRLLDSEGSLVAPQNPTRQSVLD